MEFSAETVKKTGRNKKLLEKKLNVNINIKNNEIELEGKTENVFP